MRRFLLSLIAITASVFQACIFQQTVQAGELEQAYQKEYAYLVAEKKALQQRLENLKTSQQKNLNKVSKEIAGLQKVFLAKKNLTDRLNRQIVDASRDADQVENDGLLLDTTLVQAKESLKKLGAKVDEKASIDEQLATAVMLANKVLISDGQVSTSEGEYFLADGEAVKGKIVNVGRVAKYGVSQQGGGILAPAGNGQYKVWDGQTSATAEQLTANATPGTIDVFLYDNAEKGIEKQAEKSFSDDVRASGMVGEFIIALGIAAIILVILRAVTLVRASDNIQKIAAKVNEKIASGDTDGALKVCKKNISAAANVIAATVRNLQRDRDHIEDIISESILHESSYIDRFGAAILVIAAIAPLLGLLGTVTGMISTFDIITEFGTGDPKLLSSGISEALLTTEFGLIVAIPTLLIGNLLSNWARRIKSDLEQAALHMINTHKS
jgi:biopolymer transport protein ExbB